MADNDALADVWASVITHWRKDKRSTLPLVEPLTSSYAYEMSPTTEPELLASSDACFAELLAAKRLGAVYPRICHHFFPRDGEQTDCYIPELPRMIRAIVPEAWIDVLVV
jgi:hypothetical protein